MAGFSLGGLTACYAAFKFSSVFSRALCLSPSVWWNKGDLGQAISDAYPLQVPPKSVILYLGSAEIYADFDDALLKPWDAWVVYVQQTAEAFAKNKGVYVGGALTDGGFHLISSWFYFNGWLHLFFSKMYRERVLPLLLVEMYQFQSKPGIDPLLPTRSGHTSFVDYVFLFLFSLNGRF
jgi:hypothetical protein